MPVPMSYKTPNYRSDSSSSGSSFDLDASASMNLFVLAIITTWLYMPMFEALYISFAHGEGGSDFAMVGGSLRNIRLAPGPASHRSYMPSAESAAPDSVMPAPNSLFFVGMIFLVGGIWACVAQMLGLFGCCSRNRAAALASVVPSPSEGAPSGQPQQEAFTEVPGALQFQL